MMEGETYLWFKIAARTSTPVLRCMEETPSRHFVLWHHFFEKEWRDKTKEEFYLAKLGYHLYLVQWTIQNFLNKSPGEPKLDFPQFFIKWKDLDEEEKFLTEEEKRKKEREELDKKRMEAAKSKSAWFGMLNLAMDGQPVLQKGSVKKRPPPKRPKNYVRPTRRDIPAEAAK